MVFFHPSALASKLASLPGKKIPLSKAERPLVARPGLSPAPYRRPALIHSAFALPKWPHPAAPDGFVFPVRLGERAHHTAGKNKTPRKTRGHLLPDLDSNQDKQNQNLSYYHYTIGQSVSLKGVQK
jgi:hypothetical protein